MVTIAASRVWALNTQRRLLWTSHAPIAGGWPSRGCGPGFASCKGAGYPCLCRDLGFPLVATEGRLLPAVAGLVLRWQWGILLQKQRGLLLLPALRYRWSCLGNGLAPPMEGGYRLYPLALPPTIGCRSLHRRVSQTNPEMMVQYRCHPPAVSGAGFGSGNGGYACPGRWECWARVEASTVSRTLKAGRLVSRGGPRWFSGPHPGAFLPGSAWWAHWNMDGTFHCQKPLQWLILPRHPWRRSGAGVYGGPAGGAIGCDAIVSKDRFGSHMCISTVSLRARVSRQTSCYSKRLQSPPIFHMHLTIVHMCNCLWTSLGKVRASAASLFWAERVRFPSVIQSYWVGSAIATVTDLPMGALTCAKK